MLLLDLKHSGKLCEDLIIRGSNDGSNGNDTEEAPSPLRVWSQHARNCTTLKTRVALDVSGAAGATA